MAFYVYVLISIATEKVFYVGKGSKDRLLHHRYVLAHPQTKEFNRGVYQRMRAVLNGSNFKEHKIFESDDEITALLKEQELIRYYGFENLVNTQSHAFTGRKLKPEVGQLIASKLKGRTMPPEVRAKISASGMGRQASEETRHKLSQSLSATYQGKFSETHKKALSIAAKTRKPRSKEGEENRLQALRFALCGKPKDTSKARSARKQRYYTIVSPNGTTYDAQSKGILSLLKTLELPFSNFYRAIKLGEYNGWKATLRSLSRLAYG
jgi:hypothetical protein